LVNGSTHISAHSLMSTSCMYTVGLYYGGTSGHRNSETQTHFPAKSTHTHTHTHAHSNITPIITIWPRTRWLTDQQVWFPVDFQEFPGYIFMKIQ